MVPEAQVLIGVAAVLAAFSRYAAVLAELRRWRKAARH